MIGYLSRDTTLVNTASLVYPADGVAQHYTMGCNPAVLYEGQSIKVVFGAAASKSGTSYYYLNILRFEVGKV